MKVLMIVIMFFLLGGFFIISNENIHLNSADDRAELFELYTGWADGLFGNGKGVVGHVVKMEWLPEHG